MSVSEKKEKANIGFKALQTLNEKNKQLEAANEKLKDKTRYVGNTAKWNASLRAITKQEIKELEQEKLLRWLPIAAFLLQQKN